MRKTIFISIIFLINAAAFAQHPLKHFSDAIEMRFSNSQPVINYVLRIDAADTTMINVEVHLNNMPDTFHVGMIAHPEYDDRYWRFAEGLRIEPADGKGNIFREDSTLWRIVAHGGKSVLYYRIHLPASPPQRPAWRPFLSPTGGLIGDLHSLMYVVGATLAPSHITLQLPNEWKIATGLEPTADPNTFFASSAGVLADCPILVGLFKNWQFKVDGVPHRVVYLPLPNAKDFDTTLLVSSIKKIVEQASKLFGRLPYREYSFLLQDGAYGALEHANSVTIGIPVSEIENDFTGIVSEISHEYFHVWNLMRIRPVEYSDVSYKTPQLSKGLWWSEGLTMFYADALLRRAGLPVEDSLRIKHIERTIGYYFSSSGNYKISAENVSRASNAEPGMLGDYSASTHTQGELIGVMLDLLIRNETNGKKTMDDVMRKMFEKFSGETGFKAEDIKRMIMDVCGRGVSAFFKSCVYGNNVIDFNKYLQLIGMQMKLQWVDDADKDGKLQPDLNVYAWQKDTGPILLGIMDPEGCWAKAGLHTNDRIIRVNETIIKNARQFRMIVGRLHIDDTINIEVKRASGIFKTIVKVSGYKIPKVIITPISNQTERQRKLYIEWLKG